MKLSPTQGEAPHACPPTVAATAAVFSASYHAPCCLAQIPAAIFHSPMEQWHYKGLRNLNKMEKSEEASNEISQYFNHGVA